MIYVSKRQLDQVEYLIQQSIQGNHVLFDPQAVREILNNTSDRYAIPMSESDAYSVEHHIEKLILQPSLEQKRAYLEHLDADTFQKVVKTYFNIVENNIFESNGVKH